MGLLEDLMDYSSWKNSRENDLRAYRRQQESKRDATLRSLDAEAQNLRDEIDANLRQYGELKKIAMQGFDIAFFSLIAVACCKVSFNSSIVFKNSWFLLFNSSIIFRLS